MFTLDLNPHGSKPLVSMALPKNQKLRSSSLLRKFLTLTCSSQSFSSHRLLASKKPLKLPGARTWRYRRHVLWFGIEGRIMEWSPSKEPEDFSSPNSTIPNKPALACAVKAFSLLSFANKDFRTLSSLLPKPFGYLGRTFQVLQRVPKAALKVQKRRPHGIA